MLLRIIWISIMSIITMSVYPQQYSPKLSQKHIDVIETTKDPAKKLKQYKKYFHKDSLKQANLLDKYWKLQSDSISGVLQDGADSKKDKTTEASLIKIRAKLSESGMPIESLKPAKEFGQYTNALQKFKGSISNLDSLKGLSLEENEDRILEQAASHVDGLSELQQLKNQKGELGKLQSTAENYKSQVEEYSDSTKIKEAAKKKAEEMAMKYLSENPQIMNGVRTKVNLLMKKYSVVPNSNDLSSAVKRTSLKGKTFKERLVIAANFQVPSLDPFSIDLSPALGYKFNRKFVVGIGGNYRQTFGKDSTSRIAPKVLGYKLFTSYDVMSNFFAYGEYNQNTTGIHHTESGSNRIWKQALLVGVGRKFTVHPKIEMTIVFTYNFLYEKNDPIYTRPWVIKVGFQTSEIAMLAKKFTQF